MYYSSAVLLYTHSPLGMMVFGKLLQIAAAAAAAQQRTAASASLRMLPMIVSVLTRHCDPKSCHPAPALDTPSHGGPPPSSPAPAAAPERRTLALAERFLAPHQKSP